MNSDKLSGHKHRQIIEDCLAYKNGAIVPISFWRHFPVDDQTPASLAEAIFIFQTQYDFDFVKITPASSFCIKDWGAEDTWKGSLEGTRVYEFPVIGKPEDWFLLDIKDPYKGYLKKQLDCIHLLRSRLPPGTPLIQTIFSPLSQAKNLVGKSNLLHHLHCFTNEISHGLRIIEQTTLNFIEACKDAGVDGFFLAMQYAQSHILSHEEFLTFEYQPSMRVFEPALSCWVNIVHLHGENLYFDTAKTFPVPIINWHDQFTPPSLENARKACEKVLCGGLKQLETMALGTPEKVIAETHRAIDSMDSSKFILGTGCVLPIVTPMSNIIAAIKTVRSG